MAKAKMMICNNMEYCRMHGWDKCSYFKPHKKKEWCDINEKCMCYPNHCIPYKPNKKRGK